MMDFNHDLEYTNPCCWLLMLLFIFIYMLLSIIIPIKTINKPYTNHVKLKLNHATPMPWRCHDDRPLPPKSSGDKASNSTSAASTCKPIFLGDQRSLPLYWASTGWQPTNKMGLSTAMVVPNQAIRAIANRETNYVRVHHF